MPQRVVVLIVGHTTLSRRHLLILLVAALVGCAPYQFRDPLATMLDRQQSPIHRLDAARQSQKQRPDDPALFGALNQLAWTRGHPLSLRQFAIDQLVARDEAKFQRDLAARISRIYNAQVLEYLFNLAIERRWPNTTAVIVHSLGRLPAVLPGELRPEISALQRLHPDQTVRQVAFDILVNANGNAALSEQAAAWQLLHRITDRDELIGYLHRAADTTPLLLDLKAAAFDLQVLPRNRHQILWLLYLRDTQNRVRWSQTRAAVDSLKLQQREALALRHLTPLLRSDAEARRIGRNGLMAQVQARLGGAEHHVIWSEWQGTRTEYPQHLADWADRLSWGDLLSLRLLIQVLGDRALVADLFRQADADLADQQSEHGGALVQCGGSIVAQRHKPLLRQHDRRYISPPNLIERLYTATAHYHFHAQHVDNAEFAAPGRGDRDFADRWGFHCLVFTFIDRNRLNVDYYGPGGVVIDLGTILRPLCAAGPSVVR